MSLNYVTLTGQLPGGAGAIAIFTPSNWLDDATDSLLLPPAPVQANLNGLGKFSVSLPATDNAALPAGWYWTVEFAGIPSAVPYSFSFYLPHAGGATQDISGVASLPNPTPITTYMPVPSGTPQAGYVPVASGSGEASAWAAVSGSNAVASVFGRTGAVAAQSGDYTAAQVGADTSGAAAAAQSAAQAYADTNKLAKSANLSDVASASTSRTNLGLGSAAQQASSAFLQPANNLSDVTTPATALTNLGGLSLVVATAVAGYTMVNGTGTILTWTAPSDSKLHRVLIFATLSVTVTEVGGTLQSKIFAPDGTSVFTSIFGAAQAAGTQVKVVGAIAEAGQPVTIQQTSALTSGTATLWAEIWAL